MPLDRVPGQRFDALTALPFAVICAAALSLCQCASPVQRAASSAGARPEAIEITPASGPAGPSYPIQATIRGGNFAPAGNTVRFGPITILDLPSFDGGTRITFSVPKLVASAGEVAPLVLPPGDYRVTVTNAHGSSNALTFTLTRSR
jgi:hypothetical protein